MIFFVEVTESFPWLNLILTVVYNWNEKNCIYKIFHGKQKCQYQMLYICIYARNIYSAFLSQHLSKLPSNQVLNWLCHHKYFVGFACSSKLMSSHYNTATTKWFCVEVFSLNRSYHQVDHQTLFFSFFSTQCQCHAFSGQSTLTLRGKAL